MIELNKITIICVDCYSYGKAVEALQKCNEQVKAVRTVLLTDIPLGIEGIEIIQIPTIRSKEEYSHFIIKELYKYFDTEFCLIVQQDGYILNGDCWDDEFYNYDVLGAAWLYIDHKNNSNGGFSLRSKRLQTILGTDDFIQASDPEDQAIGRLYRDYLIKTHGIKFPTDDICDRFSFELREPMCKTFGFHGYFHNPYQPTIVLKRSAAIGDCIIMEPVMRYYAAKGYNIVLDIPMSYFPLFNQHYFPVKHISQFDKGRIKPEKEVDLDMAYEVKPRQSYLKSYFEFCGIDDFKLSRPVLFPLVDERTKPFKKYAVVHIDNRETPHRNIYDVDWKKVDKHLESLNYIVIQIGSNQHERCGIEYNTTDNIGMMKFIIAGCDLFIGVDSGPSHIAMAYNKPCVLFFGSVNPSYIHADLTNTEIIQGNCDKAYCWHQVGGTSGKECFYKETEKFVQCCKSAWEMVVDAVNKLTNNAP